MCTPYDPNRDEQRSSYDASLRDRCVIWRYSTTERDGFNRPKPGYVADSSETPCGVNWRPSREVSNGTQMVLPDLEVRLSRTVQLDQRDQIEIVATGGTPITPTVRCQIIGGSQPGPVGQRVPLQRVAAGVSQ